MTRPLLLCTVGLPRSGKTTWARALCGKHGIPLVSADAVRLGLHGQRYIETAEPMVHTIVGVMVRSLFHAGHQTVLLDECLINARRRMPWRSASGGFLWQQAWVVFEAPAAECIRRAGTDRVLVPVIERMAADRDRIDGGLSEGPIFATILEDGRELRETWAETIDLGGMA
jgi:predicted kinase